MPEICEYDSEENVDNIAGISDSGWITIHHIPTDNPFLGRMLEKSASSIPPISMMVTA
jgi:hypothetical protein